MTINKETNGTTLTIALEGRLDTTTAPQLDAELDYSGIEQLIFDFAKLEYISSAGLRVLLTAQKAMNKQGSMKVTNVNEAIAEIFEVTGFDSILTVDKD